MTVGAGRGSSLERTVTSRPGVVISVVVRLSVDAPPGRNSSTRPRTRTWSPTSTSVSTLGPNTRMPSEVASSVSGLGSCIHKLPGRLTVTIPSTTATSWPLRGETWAAPWTSWIRLTTGVCELAGAARAATVNAAANTADTTRIGRVPSLSKQDRGEMYGPGKPPRWLPSDTTVKSPRRSSRFEAPTTADDHGADIWHTLALL